MTNRSVRNLINNIDVSVERLKAAGDHSSLVQIDHCLVDDCQMILTVTRRHQIVQRQRAFHDVVTVTISRQTVRAEFHKPPISSLGKM